MDDWQAKIAACEQRLAEWNRAFERHYVELARKRKRWLRPLAEADKSEIASEARKLAGEAMAIEVFGFLSELCDAYLAEVLPQNRAKTRAWVGSRPNVLNAVWNYATQAPELVRQPQDEPALLRGLAAISLDDVRADYNEVVEAIGALWIAARKAGLDPAPAIERVAALSNPGMGGGGAHLQRTLREFASSSYFRDHVRPRLPRASA